ncbi:HAD-IA family hydrolase [Altericista sp. CCNU0014]|uniref:HAD-IA family hydrolase n=1 Tax=Altericista sp. CCNU0014 TaxID=3082949 RepID=UPI00384BBD51
MNLPQTIFFDAVGTLFDVRGTVGEIYAQFARQAGVRVDPQQLNTAFIQSFRTAPRAAFANASPQALLRLEYEWWRAVACQSFETAGALSGLEDFDAFFQPLFTYFETAAPWILYPETLKSLERVKALGIETAIISNFDSRLYAVLQALELDSWFQSITLSTQIGAAKPDPAIFEAALEKHRVLPTQAWHVGDSWTEDYAGATAAGLRGVWLNRKGAQPDLGAQAMVAARLEISDLAALEGILQAQS